MTFLDGSVARYRTLLLVITGFLCLIPADEIHAQITIQERMELGVPRQYRTSATEQPAQFEHNRLFLGNGGDIRVHINRSYWYNFDDWVLYEKNLGKISEATEENTVKLGTYPQWTGFSFYLVNKKDGTKRYPMDSESGCNISLLGLLGGTFTFVEFNHMHLTVHIKPDSALAAKPSRRIMNCLNANPFSPDGGVSYEKNQWVYYRIKGGKILCRYRPVS